MTGGIVQELREPSPTPLLLRRPLVSGVFNAIPPTGEPRCGPRRLLCPHQQGYPRAHAVPILWVYGEVAFYGSFDLVSTW